MVRFSWRGALGAGPAWTATGDVGPSADMQVPEAALGLMVAMAEVGTGLDTGLGAGAVGVSAVV